MSNWGNWFQGYRRSPDKMTNDRIDATQFSLLHKLKSALVWCISACRPSHETSDPTGIFMQSESKSSMSLQYLKEITNNFCDDRILGKGAFGTVYMGLLHNGEMVAVKKLSQANQGSQDQFENEVNLLMKLKHPNIVQLVGYCYETQHIRGKRHDGQFVFALDSECMLCLECLPVGSLDKYISDASSGLSWHTRCKVIEGISYGLQYLHEHSNKPVIHLDLKPGNVLLDENMLPKITDFGLSRLFDHNQTIYTAIKRGTFGYMPPEFTRGIITPMWDIFSLGVIIMEVITGHRLYPDDVRKSCKGFIELELQKWRNRLQKESVYTSLETDCQQIERYIQVGLICVNPDRAKRPSIKKVVAMLDGSESMDWHISNKAEDAPNNVHDTPSTSLETISEAEDAPNDLHDIPSTSRETTSEAEDAPNDLHHTPSTSRETTSENVIVAEAGGTGSLLSKLNEAMRSLNPDIKRCLEYCNMFPRGSKLRRNDLVNLWIAQGFIKTRCATDDMEDIAGRYIQELVSCSFLQPVRTSSYLFTIHDNLHDILDKVVGNCFRIENPRRNVGEDWEGYVPRHIQHLLILNYDGELITETIIGLEYLQTLIVYVVQKDTPVEEKVIESICKRLPKLRVLAIAFSQEHDRVEQPNKFSFPESIGQLNYLRYLSFRTNNSCKITLPNTLNKLQHIQLLDFGDGDISEFTFAELVKLRHIFCFPLVKLPYVGRLRSLQSLPRFKVSNEQGCELKQLRGLNKLRGQIWISGLQNVKSKGQALEANLAAKRLTELTLQWGYSDYTTCSPDVEADVLEGLCPPVGLHKLILGNFAGKKYPHWMVGKQNGGPKYLQELHLMRCRLLVPSGLVDAFPHLRVLTLDGCSWDVLPDSIKYLISLKELCIQSCWNIRTLSSLPRSLQKFSIIGCNDDLIKSCNTIGHPNWQNIKDVPSKEIRQSNLKEGIICFDING